MTIAIDAAAWNREIPGVRAHTNYGRPIAEM